MRLVTFAVETPLGPFERLGALAGQDKVVDLNAAASWDLLRRGKPAPERLADSLLPPGMIAFLEGGSRSLAAAREALAAGRAAPAKARGARGERLAYALPEVRLRAPLPRPPALRDFLAFEEHARQGAARRGESLAKEWYEAPIYYKGNHREIYGPDDLVPWPEYTRKLDFELEVACVVGRAGRNLTPARAARHIAGYTILNDFSARDVQKREMLTRMGPAKGKDFATALGPWLLTADELPRPGGLRLAVRVNGRRWSSGSFAARHWGFPAMLSHVSREETLQPGDVLGSGTFYKGCGLDLGRWLEPGDTVELEVERLGILRNRVGRPKAFRPLKQRWPWS